MVSVKKNIKDINKYTWETVYFVSKPLIVIGIICIPLIVYFFVVGNLPNPNKELLRYGYTLLFLLIIMIINSIRLYFYYKKNLKFFFRDADFNGDIEVTISCEGDEYIIENRSGKCSNRLRKTDIAKIRVMKKCVFIKTKANQVMFFPKTDEVLQLFTEK